VPGCERADPAAWIANRPFKRSKYLMPKKRGESNAPPKFTSHEHPSIFSKIDDKTRGTLLFDKHFLNGVIYP